MDCFVANIRKEPLTCTFVWELMVATKEPKVWESGKVNVPQLCWPLSVVGYKRPERF